MASQVRQEREKHLQRRVQETLRLSPPDLPPQAGADAGTYTTSPSSEEQNATALRYKNKLRVNRILQVRAQEALLASQRVSQFRARKTQNSNKLLTHLKDVWRDHQRQRITHLEREFASCRSIGLSHEAALLVERNRAAKEAFVARQAQESRCWDTLRFKQAMHQERELRELRETGDNCAPAFRRRTTKSVSYVERSLTRRYNNHGAKPKPHAKQAHGTTENTQHLLW